MTSIVLNRMSNAVSKKMLYLQLNKSKVIESQIYQLYSTQKQGSHKPNTLEKYLLVWMKKYPSVKEVPATVTADMMERVRNKSRIKINIIMCIVTAVVCVGMIISGKNAAKRGESLSKMNAKWHEEQNMKK